MRKKYINLAFKCMKKKSLGYIFRQPVKLLGLALSVILQKRFISPLIATLIPTYRCQSFCRKCVKKNSYHASPEMSTNEFKNIISQLSEMKVSAIDFSGGEPLLRDDIMDLLSFASKKGIFTHISTNGYLLDRKKAETLISCGIDSINISLDSTSSDKIEQLTGIKGAFLKITDAIKLLLEARGKQKKTTEIGVVTVLDEDNYDELPKIIFLLKKYGIDGLTVNPLHLFPNSLIKNSISEKNPGIISDLLRIKRTEPLLENSARYLKLLKHFWNGEPLPIKCLAGYSHVIIDTYKRLFPCLHWHELGGESIILHELNIRKALGSDLYRRITRKTLQCRSCYWNCYIETSLIFDPLLSLFYKSKSD